MANMTEQEYNQRVAENMQAIIDAISAIPCRYPGREAFSVGIQEEAAISGERKIYVDFRDNTEVIVVKLS